MKNFKRTTAGNSRNKQKRQLSHKSKPGIKMPYPNQRKKKKKEEQTLQNYVTNTGDPHNDGLLVVTNPKQGTLQNTHTCYSSSGGPFLFEETPKAEALTFGFSYVEAKPN